MEPKTFADFLKTIHEQVHVKEAAADTSQVFDIGYALGKLCAHYKRKLTEDELTDFDKGMLLGYDVGFLHRVQ